MSPLRIAFGVGSVAAAILCAALMEFGADPAMSGAAGDTLCLAVCALATGILATLVWPRHRILLQVLMAPVAICAVWFLWSSLGASSTVTYTAGSFLAIWVAYCGLCLQGPSRA